jgi:hypothetical protein
MGTAGIARDEWVQVWVWVWATRCGDRQVGIGEGRRVADVSTSIRKEKKSLPTHPFARRWWAAGR